MTKEQVAAQKLMEAKARAKKLRGSDKDVFIDQELLEKCAEDIERLLKCVEVLSDELTDACICLGEPDYHGKEIKCDRCDALARSAEILGGDE